MLPTGVKLLIALATVLIVSAIALLVGEPSVGPVVPMSALVAGSIAFAFVAWRIQHQR